MIKRKYLWYVLRHKWFVFIECCKLGIPWQGIIHDVSKFSKYEFMPYARYFYEREKLVVYYEAKRGDGLRINRQQEYVVVDSKKDGTSNAFIIEVVKKEISEAFDLAWEHHISKNKHHNQAWILSFCNGYNSMSPMPDKYRKEMLADLLAGDKMPEMIPAKEYYEKYGDKMQLHDETRRWLEQRIN